MAKDYRRQEFEFINTESKKPLWFLPSIKETAPMDDERIKECLNGVAEAVEDELDSHDIEQYSISYGREDEKERRMDVQLPEASFKVKADVKEASKRGLRNFTFDPGFVSPGTTPRIAGDLKEKIDDARLSVRYRFRSDNERYDTLYKDISERLKGLKQQLDLSEGTHFS